MPRPMTTSPHVLLVEDDRDISALVSRFLVANEFCVSTAANGREMDKTLETSRVDLVVLDIMLPGEDGLSICRRIRANSELPVIMLTAKGEDVDRIIGLELGADDYVTKPFNPRELLARIRVVLRRGGVARAKIPETEPLTFSGWHLDPHVRKLHSPDGARVALTGAEFDLLLAFCQHPRRVLSRDQLMDLTQGRRTTGPFDRSIDVLVSRLRQKMEKDPRAPLLIQTIRSGGYMFSPEVEAT
jgi:two-component system OmpR family response regulator